MDWDPDSFSNSPTRPGAEEEEVPYEKFWSVVLTVIGLLIFGFVGIGVVGLLVFGIRQIF